jgi:ABC-type multidrug transport system permease subunit
MHPIVQIVLARTREFFREPEAIFWVYGFPILMTVALGIAFRDQAPETIVVAVEQGPAADWILAALNQASPSESAPSSSFKVEIVATDEAHRRLRTGRTSLVVRSTPGHDQTSPTALEFQFDPTRPDGLLARRAVDDRLQRAAGRPDTITVQDLAFSEPGGRYIDFLIPGLIGASLMGGGLWGIGFATVDLRVRNLLKRLLTTPMRKSHFLGGLMISRFLFMIPEVLVILLFARWMFGVHVFGSWGLVLVILSLGAFTFAGIGLLVACRAKTIETASGLMNLVMLPMYVLSGIFFSSERFPEAAQPWIRLLPLTSLIDALRAVMLEGHSLPHIQFEMVNMLLWSVISFLLALRFFRWY